MQTFKLSDILKDLEVPMDSNYSLKRYITFIFVYSEKHSIAPQDMQIDWDTFAKEHYTFQMKINYR